MPSTTTPIRLDAEITSAARRTARRMSRSISEQVSHWARIGRELERSPDVSVAQIERVLEGQHSYDALTAREQAVVRGLWTERMDALRGELRLDQDFAASGHRYAELDENGEVRMSKAR